MCNRTIRFLSLLAALVSALALFSPGMGGVSLVRAAASDLIISEYIEHTGNNDAIEIYNGTGAAVNLSAYRIEIFSAGSPVPSADVDLSGTLPNDAVYVIAHPSAVPEITDFADQESTFLSWSGDDAVALVKSGTGYVDVIGQVGTDPGTSWTVGTGSTSAHTLIRDPDVCAGDTNAGNAFNGGGEWTAIPAADASALDDLGVHTSDCLGGGTGNEPDLTVSIAESADPVEVDTTVTYTFTLTNIGVDAAQNVELIVFFSGTAFSDTLVVSSGAGCAKDDFESFSCFIDSVANGAPFVATAQMTPNSAGQITVDALVTADAPEIDTNNDASAATTVTDDPPIACGSPTAAIYELQEGGAKFGQTGPFSVVGVVTGDFQGADASGLSGFFIQAATGDGNPATSDGIFVFDPEPALLAVNVGQRIQVTGTVGEAQTRTQITATAVESCGDTGTITPTAITLPIADVNHWERYEGMLVTITRAGGPLVVTATDDLGRHGTLTLADAVQFDPTEREAPGSANFIALRALNARSRIRLDDGRNATDLDDLPYLFNAPETLRRGDTTPSITGIVDTRMDTFRVQPTAAVTFTSVNARVAVPSIAGGNLRVADLNLGDYFTTLDNGTNGARGADSASELTRQTGKLLTALAVIDADVFALTEVENNGTAINTLASALNAEIGAADYAAINTGITGDNVGGTLNPDAVTNALLYKPAVVTPIGTTAVLETGPFDGPSRPPVAQAFEHIATGAQFIVVVNHFADRGCDGATGPDADQGDGQACFSAARLAAAEALQPWLLTDPTGTGASDLLIIGDLNANSQETPLNALNAEYTPLLNTLAASARYSVAENGEAALRDHALASTSLAGRVTGVTLWKISADEPRALDYNDNVADTSTTPDVLNNDLSLYVRDPYRASDRDPVIVSFNLPITDNAQPGPFTLIGPADDTFIRTLENFPELRWTPSANASSFSVAFYQLSGNARLEVIEIDVDADACAATACGLTLTPAQQELFITGTYVWTVIAENGDKLTEAGNAGFRFALNTGPIELVRNAGFEGKPNNTKVPTSWFKFGKYRGDVVRCDNATVTVARTGSCAYALKGNKGEGVSGIRQNLPFKRYKLVKGDKLALTAYVDQRTGRKGALIAELIVTYNNKKLGNKGKAKIQIKLPNNATPGYRLLTGNRTLTLAGPVKSLTARVLYGPPGGQVFVDDLSVVILPVDGVGSLAVGEMTAPAAPSNGLRGID